MIWPGATALMVVSASASAQRGSYGTPQYQTSQPQSRAYARPTAQPAVNPAEYGSPGMQAVSANPERLPCPDDLGCPDRCSSHADEDDGGPDSGLTPRSRLTNANPFATGAKGRGARPDTNHQKIIVHN